MKRSDSPIGFDHRAIFVGLGGVVDEVQVPVLRVVQVGETAVDQGADEIDRQAARS